MIGRKGTKTMADNMLLVEATQECVFNLRVEMRQRLLRGPLEPWGTPQARYHRGRAHRLAAL